MALVPSDRAGILRESTGGRTSSRYDRHLGQSEVTLEPRVSAGWSLLGALV